MSLILDPEYRNLDSLTAGFPLALEKWKTGKMREVFPVREKSGNLKFYRKVREKSGNFV